MRFTVIKEAKAFVRPSEPTPCGTLHLSAIDLLPGLRDELIQVLHVFKHGQRPAKVIKEALSKTLIPYYPLAGRFANSDHDEVRAIECNGEGVGFVEAIANCTLEDVSYLDHVPLMISKSDLFLDPRLERETRDVPITMQVTEFRCGGFVVGFTFNHAIVDAIGAAQFMKAVGDFARGNTVPTIKPIWSRHLLPKLPKLLSGRPCEMFPTFKLHSSTFHLPISHIKKVKSAYFKKWGNHCTTFEISTATIWQARTRVINIDNPETHVHVVFSANIRHLLASTIFPQGGYYGNCIYSIMITAMSGDIISADLVDIVMKIHDGKKRLPEELGKWSRGELKENPYDVPISYNIFYVSEWTNLEFSCVDYGWGKPAHVIPFAMDGCPMAVFGKPLVLESGSRLLLQCVKEEHASSFQEHMSGLVL